MLRTSMNLSERGYGLFRYAPTNLLLGAIRYRRRGLKWGIPAMLLLGGGYYFATAICYTIIQREGPGPLYLWSCCSSGTHSSSSGSDPSASSSSCGAGARSVSEAADRLGHAGRLL
ncbi:hypothetical protein [Aestuariimicrobium ganziense]|uniref:hypothetical protein n=1 Tax=Aestuariimicrobium ganziense TaxID=2773677 RepID=UPI001944C098|nr:hypothetical protein [Aestuariimicrobium ganziense]